MNGPDSASLNIKKISDEILAGKLLVIVTNGALVHLGLPDHPNVVYLVNDPVLSEYFKEDFRGFSDRKLIKMLRSYDFNDDMIEASVHDYDSCVLAKSSKAITIATDVEAGAATCFNNERLITSRYGLLDKILYRLSYTWYQNGQLPTGFWKRWGLKMYPIESRLVRLLLRFKWFAVFWYEIVKAQTPNTFYMALDLAGYLSPRNVIFVGRNSQLEDWLRQDRDINGNLECNYNYFFADHVQKISVKSIEGLMREAVFSSQYIELFRIRYQLEEVCSLIDSVPYRDCYSSKMNSKYIMA